MIDWARVRELQAELGEDEFEPVLELFIDELEEVAMRLGGQNPDCLEADVHFLRGCALNLGLKSFAALCCESEGVARAGKRFDIDKLLAGYAEAKRALLAGLLESKRSADVA